MHTMNLRTGKLVLLYVLQLVNMLIITVLIAGIIK